MSNSWADHFSGLGKQRDSSPEVILRPWGEKWQIWLTDKKQTAWELAREEAISHLKSSKKTLVAIPARMVLAVPLWIDATDSETVQQMAVLQVEMMRLASVDRLLSDVVIQTLIRKDDRTLILALVFPLSWPAELARLEAGYYEPNPLAGKLQDHSLHLWREGDDLVATITGTDHVICWETIHWTTDKKEIETWLNCLLTQLENELMLDSKLSLVDWTGELCNLAIFTKATSLSEEERRIGPPIQATQTTNWKPLARRLAEGSRRKKGALLRIALGVAIVGLVFLAAAAIASLNLRFQIESADQKVAALEKRAGPLRQTAMQWEQIETSTNPRFFPLEILHVVVAAMPPSGIHLTAFETSKDKVLVEGEADNVNTVTHFFNVLQGENGITGVKWIMPPPSLLPNNTAKFSFSGQLQRGDD